MPPLTLNGATLTKRGNGVETKLVGGERRLFLTHFDIARRLPLEQVPQGPPKTRGIAIRTRGEHGPPLRHFCKKGGAGVRYFNLLSKNSLRCRPTPAPLFVTQRIIGALAGCDIL